MNQISSQCEWNNTDYFTVDNYLKWKFSDPSLLPNEIKAEMNKFELWIIWQDYKWNDIPSMLNNNIYFNMRLFHKLVKESICKFNALVKIIIKELNVNEESAKKIAWKILTENDN